MRIRGMKKTYGAAERPGNLRLHADKAGLQAADVFPNIPLERTCDLVAGVAVLLVFADTRGGKHCATTSGLYLAYSQACVHRFKVDTAFVTLQQFFCSTHIYMHSP